MTRSVQIIICTDAHLRLLPASQGFSYMIPVSAGAQVDERHEHQIRPTARSAHVQWGEVFASTSTGDAFDRAAVAAQSQALYACPNYQASSFSTSSGISCLLSWNAWSSSGNQPVDANMTTAGDVDYINTFGSDVYMMHSYNKNWILRVLIPASDLLRRLPMEQPLGGGTSLAPQFLEILTWTFHYRESHYIGPLHPKAPSVYAGNTSTGAVEWVTGFVLHMTVTSGITLTNSFSSHIMPHDAWRDVAVVYIAAYKAGASAPTVKSFSLTRDGGATVVMTGTSDFQVSSSSCTVYNFNAYVGSVTA
ncbi:glycoside hydrolase family 71 protein [Athelia psychrophila]|uniref:Glycoside hydrolase family 71 protein n=1 Tax=Athelia psychrophila TaxID=1759441 RepID=A0A166KZU6_9AGAM|nr:glycoside hydrolase family 71 protein [Fibularhizoctonia sp. CBS 109695]